MANLLLVAFVLGCGLMVFVMFAFPQLGPERNALALAYNDIRIGMPQEEVLNLIKKHFSKKPRSSYPASAYDMECEVWCWQKQDGWSYSKAFLEVEFNKDFNVREAKYSYSLVNSQGMKLIQWIKSLEHEVYMPFWKLGR